MKGVCGKCGLALNEKSRCDVCIKKYYKQYQTNNRARKNELSKLYRIKNKAQNNKKLILNNMTVEGMCHTLFKRSRRRANHAKITFDLDIKCIESLWMSQKGCCALTGRQFENIELRCTKDTPFSPSIDRIDSSLGYTMENVRIVCLIVNYSLGNFGDKFLKIICEEFIKHNHENTNI